MSENYLEIIKWLWTEHEKNLMEKHKLIVEKEKLEIRVEMLEKKLAGEQKQCNS